MKRLRIVTCNIQCGVSTERYRHYMTQGWRHFVPNTKTRRNLDQIAQQLRPYDLVAIQEADLGSLRNRGLDQVAYLADAAGFPHYEAILNRDVGRYAQHALALLSKRPLHDIDRHRLPGRVPGRGALTARVEWGDEQLLVVATHLALGAQPRRQQLARISEVIAGEPHVVVLGDFNCSPKWLDREGWLDNTGLVLASGGALTHPSWQPKRSIDHIAVSKDFDVRAVELLSPVHSDHLSVAVEIEAGFESRLPELLPDPIKDSLIRARRLRHAAAEVKGAASRMRRRARSILRHRH